jgi:hypothetical protein
MKLRTKIKISFIFAQEKEEHILRCKYIKTQTDLSKENYKIVMKERKEVINNQTEICVHGLKD